MMVTTIKRIYLGGIYGIHLKMLSRTLVDHHVRTKQEELVELSFKEIGC